MRLLFIIICSLLLAGCLGASKKPSKKDFLKDWYAECLRKHPAPHYYVPKTSRLKEGDLTVYEKNSFTMGLASLEDIEEDRVKERKRYYDWCVAKGASEYEKAVAKYAQENPPLFTPGVVSDLVEALDELEADRRARAPKVCYMQPLGNNAVSMRCPFE